MYQHHMHGCEVGCSASPLGYFDQGQPAQFTVKGRKRGYGADDDGEETGHCQRPIRRPPRLPHHSSLSKTTCQGLAEKTGPKPGHKGHRRPSPERIDQQGAPAAPCCPHCQGRLNRCADPHPLHRRHSREHRAGGDRARDPSRLVPALQEVGRAAVPDALPGSQIGNRVVALSAWLHYGLGQTLDHIVEVFNCHLHFKLTAGGLVQQWYRLQEILYPWYEQIQAQACELGRAHADETGWRVNGKGHWLWCFTTPRLTCYLIDRRRGQPVVARFSARRFAARWSPISGDRTTRWSVRRGRSAWCTCCATWSTSSVTRACRRNGRNLPRNCGDWSATASA